MALLRFGKSTHISMISNSVTHLQRYTNFAIADITGNSMLILPEMTHERQYRHAEFRCLCVERRCLRIGR